MLRSMAASGVGAGVDRGGYGSAPADRPDFHRGPRAPLAWLSGAAALLAFAARSYKVEGNLALRGRTAREREVLHLIARGYLYKEVGQELGISPKTVEHHVSAVLRKLQLSRPPPAQPLGGRAAAARPVAPCVRFVQDRLSPRALGWSHPTKEPQ